MLEGIGVGNHSNSTSTLAEGTMVESKAWDWVTGAHPRWLTPSEESHYLAHRWQELGYKTLLDLGCGLGRHSIFFARHGFDVKAYDLSPEGVQHLCDWSQREGLAVETGVGDMLRLPYADHSIDCLFAYHVIYHTDTAGFHKALAEITRVLKPGGEFFLTLSAKDTWSFAEAGYPHADENTVIKTEQGAEQGVPHFFVSLDDIMELFAGFDLARVRHVDDCYSDGSKRNSRHYFVLGRQ